MIDDVKLEDITTGINDMNDAKIDSPQIIEIPKKIIRTPKIKFNDQIVTQIVESRQITNTSNDMFVIKSYKIPKQTLYITILLIVIGAFIWKISNPVIMNNNNNINNNNNNNNNNDHDDNDDNDDDDDDN